MPPGESCALDLADAGARTLEEVARLLGVTRARIGQVEDTALVQLRRRTPHHERFEPVEAGGLAAIGEGCGGGGGDEEDVRRERHPDVSARIMSDDAEGFAERVWQTYERESDAATTREAEAAQ